MNHSGIIGLVHVSNILLFPGFHKRRNLKSRSFVEAPGLPRRPKELEVISCDNTYLLNELHPPLPAVDLHIAEIASRAVDGLLWRLSNPEASYQDVLIKPELILPKKK